MGTQRNQPETNLSTYIKYPLWKKICFSGGDFGGTFTWGFLSAFSMMFYTDVFGISMFGVSFIMLISRIWDGINDPIIGILADRTHTRWGRYRPWMLFATPLIVVTFTLLFWAHPDWSAPGKMAYALITYCLYVLAYTCMNMPYVAMTATLTQDPTERASISGIRLALGMIAITIVSYIGPPMVESLGGGDNSKGYVLTALCMGLIGAPFILLSFGMSRERVVPQSKEKIKLRDCVRALKGNKPLAYAMLGQFAYYFLALGRSSVYLYYFTYNVESVVLFGTFSVASRLVMAVGSATSDRWLKLIPNKGLNAAIGYCVFGVTLILQSFTHPINSPVPFWLLTMVGNYFCGVGYAQNFAIVPDAVEYGEYLGGVRMEGAISSIISLFNKIGQALGTFFVATLLGILGYVQNQPQNDAVLAGIEGIMFWGAGMVSVAIGLVFFTYKLSNSRFNEMVQKLQERRKAGAPTDDTAQQA